MGLHEKRLTKQLQETVLPDFEAKLNAITGYTIELDIRWDTFTAYDEYPLSRLENSALPDILTALSSICQDDLGKESLPTVLTRIRLENTEDENGVELHLTDGELYHKVWFTGDVYRSYSASDLIDLLEKAM